MSDVVKDTDPPKIVKDTDPPKVVKDTDPPKVVKDTDPPKVVKDTDPPKVVKDTDPPKVVKDTDPPKVVKDTYRPKVVKDTDPPKVVKDTDPPKVVKDTDPPKVVQDKGIGDLISEHLKDFLYLDLLSRRASSDIVSGNAKIILYGLFAVVGLAVLLCALTITNDKFDKWEVKPQTEFWTGNITKEGEVLQPEERLEINQQLEQVNSIYIAAISGALAFGRNINFTLMGEKRWSINTVLNSSLYWM